MGHFHPVCCRVGGRCIENAVKPHAIGIACRIDSELFADPRINQHIAIIFRQPIINRNPLLHRYGVDGLCRVQDRLYGEDCFTIYCFFTPRVSVAVLVLPVDAYLDFVQITESHAASPLQHGGSEIFVFSLTSFVMPPLTL